MQPFLEVSMGSLSKIFCLLIVFVLAVSGLMLVKPAFAQAPAPDIPEFTLNFIDNTTTIELSIKNQPYTYSNGTILYVYYDVRVKGDNEYNWVELYPLWQVSTQQSFSGSYEQLVSGRCPQQSAAQYTVLSYSAYHLPIYELSPYSSDSQVDFQVKAIVGHYSQIWVGNQSLNPRISRNDGSAILFDVESDWSSTQTITIPDTAPSTTDSLNQGPSTVPTATPILTPTSSPRAVVNVPNTTATSISGSNIMLVIGGVVFVASIFIAVSLLLYTRRLTNMLIR